MANHPWLEHKNWAVIGASTKPSRYGNMIVKKLKGAGYNTIPVTPKHEEVEGLAAYASLDEVPQDVEVANFVVNPSIGMDVLDACARKGIRKIWLQPGTVSEGLLGKARDLGLEVVEGCILVVLSY